MLRSSGCQWVSLLARGHGWATFHAAAGTGGEDGRHSGGQGPQSGAARGGQLACLCLTAGGGGGGGGLVQ